MSDRPPKPPRRHCDYPGCDNPPQLPNKDWSTTCTEHAGVPRPVLAAQERASEPAGLDVEAMHRAVCQSAWLTNSAYHDPAYPGEWPCADIVVRYQAEARFTASAAAQERPADAALRVEDKPCDVCGDPVSDAKPENTRLWRNDKGTLMGQFGHVGCIAAQPTPEPAEQEGPA